MRFLLPIATLLAALPAATARAQDDAAKLTEGVKLFERTGVPGPLAVFGDKAFAIVAAEHAGVRAAIVAGGRIGSGRVVVFGHNGYAGPAAKRPGETPALMKALVEWTAKSKARTLKVGAHGGMFGGLFQEAGFDVVELPRGAKPNGVDKLSLIGCSPLSLTAEEAAWLGDWVASGGGLLCGDTPWGWQQWNRGTRIEQQPGQGLIARAGIAYADGLTGATDPSGHIAVGPIAPLLHAARALDLMIGLDAGTATASEADIAQAHGALQLALRWMPDGEVMFREKLERLVKTREAQLVATESRPMRRSETLPRALLGIQLEMLRRLPTSKVRAHESAADFPGDVEALPQVIALEIDTSLGGWHSTGAYARPGAKIELQLPSDALGRGFSLRIGCHTDTLWHLDEWKRVPEIALEVPALEKLTTAANPFGGPVYVVVPEGCTAGRLRVQMRGAIPAPRFLLGETTREAWLTVQRARPAPWAEIGSRKLVISVPSSAIRSLEDPEALMRFWDTILDAQAELVGISKDRPRPERFVADRQISAGYMHSGYPVMTHLDVIDSVVNLAQLQTGDGMWGFVHELGHNLQRGEWTFDGTGEVTNNVIGLYSLERCCKLPEGERGHPGVNQPPSLENYVANGAQFAQWQSDPFLALSMYVQVRDAFGWEPFRKAFASYSQLTIDERPQNDDEKRDAWLVRLSDATGKDLGPFFEAWGVPTSEKARRMVERLPPWMPESLAAK
ncbi:MAG: hypothetical protein FJ298_15225 [Planctomycetes bacterium]|nr:hypothetical protein [Planctomycetota bacterium]